MNELTLSGVVDLLRLWASHNPLALALLGALSAGVGWELLEAAADAWAHHHVARRRQTDSV